MLVSLWEFDNIYSIPSSMHFQSNLIRIFFRECLPKENLIRWKFWVTTSCIQLISLSFPRLPSPHNYSPIFQSWHKTFCHQMKRKKWQSLSPIWLSQQKLQKWQIQKVIMILMFQVTGRPWIKFSKNWRWKNKKTWKSLRKKVPGKYSSQFFLIESIFHCTIHQDIES